MRIRRKKTLPLKDLTLFFQQFATLFSAGISMIDIYNLLEKSQTNRLLQTLVYRIKRHLLSGKPLYESLKQYPEYFDRLTCHLIQLGEQTGQLDTQLLKLANHYEKKLNFQRQLKQALFYPCLITVIACLVIIALISLVIPAFDALFQEQFQQLPRITQWIFKLSRHAKVGWLILFTALILFILSGRTIKKFLPLSSFPLIKSHFRQSALARFLQTLSLTYAAGLPITNGLQLAKETCEHPELKAHIDLLRHKITQGQSLHHAMSPIHLFPAFIVQLVQTGEESGKLAVMLDKSVEYLEADIYHQLARFNQLLEPLIILILGALIGGLVIAMYLPLFNVGNLL